MALPIQPSSRPRVYPLHTPNAPLLSGSDSKDQETITKQLVTILNLGAAVSEDIGAFLDSRCWENIRQEQVDIPYGPAQFYGLAHRYLYAVCGTSLLQRQATVNSRGLRRSLRDGGTESFEDICFKARETLREAKVLLAVLRAELVATSTNPQAFAQFEHGDVANVSLREVRLWCSLNTRQMREMVFSKRRSIDELREFLGK